MIRVETFQQVLHYSCVVYVRSSCVGYQFHVIIMCWLPVSRDRSLCVYYQFHVTIMCWLPVSRDHYACVGYQFHVIVTCGGYQYHVIVTCVGYQFHMINMRVLVTSFTWSLCVCWLPVSRDHCACAHARAARSSRWTSKPGPSATARARAPSRSPRVDGVPARPPETRIVLREWGVATSRLALF